MDNVKNDDYYLKKIVENLDFLIEHTQGKTRDEIERNALLVDSIHFRLIQISENSDKLSPTFKAKHNALPWRAIKGMRNLIVHDYGTVDMTIVCDTVLHSVPELYEELKDLLE